MIFSKNLLFSDGQSLSATAASTNIVDLGAVDTVLGAPAAREQDIGKGRQIPILIQLDAAATGTSPTLSVALQVDDNSSFSSAKTVATAQQIAGGAAGDRVTIFYVPEGTDERYMRLNYTLGGTTPAYSVTAGIVLADSTI